MEREGVEIEEELVLFLSSDNEDATTEDEDLSLRLSDSDMEAEAATPMVKCDYLKMSQKLQNFLRTCNHQITMEFFLPAIPARVSVQKIVDQVGILKLSLFIKCYSNYKIMLNF